jgi:hypothetical protein
MQLSYDGLANAGSRILYVVSGIAVILFLAITAALISVHRVRGEALKYIRWVAPLRIGTPYAACVTQLHDAVVPVTLPGNCERQCTLSFYFSNEWQHAFHLPPPTELVAQLEFRDGKLARKLTTMRQGIYVAEVAESEPYVSDTTTDVDSLGQLRRISVELSPLDFTRYRERAYAFNLACIGSMRGCKTDGLLQTADELEHKTPSSIPVHDVAVKGRTVDVISQLALKYRVVTGVYGISINGYQEPTIKVSIKNGTLGEAFDAITNADPRLEWRQSNGAVHFTTRNFPIALMDVTVHTFDAETDWHSGILDRLDDAPEIHAWLLDKKCPPTNRNAGAYVGPIRTAPEGYVSIHTRDLSYSSILDQFAAQSGAYLWSVERSSTSPCPMSSTWEIE